MSGEQRIDLGEITQSKVKGSAMESVLASALNSQGVKKMPAKKKGKK